MTRPTFSILVDSEENTNLAIKQLTQIALEQGIVTEQELEEMEKRNTSYKSRSKESKDIYYPELF
jgi:mannitol/fructose-specific phosphotransferase system IIA component (Ntr-type)